MNAFIPLTFSVLIREPGAHTGTNLPQPPIADKPEQVHKTLPHALSRAAAVGAVEVGPSRLSSVLKSYAVAQDKVGAARLRQDDEITKNFLSPWNATLNSSLNAAIKSRQQVKQARIALDACRMTLKNATGGPKQEQARLDVEAAEEKLVTVTEEAINLMRAVLENVSFSGPPPLRVVCVQYIDHASLARADSQLVCAHQGSASLSRPGCRCSLDHPERGRGRFDRG